MGFVCLESSAGVIVDDDVEVARHFGWVKVRPPHAKWKISKINSGANKCFFNYTKCERKT